MKTKNPFLQQLKNSPGNIFYSPLSINTAMAMTYIGTEGNTQKEMSSALLLPMDKTVVLEAYNTITQSIKVSTNERQ